MGRKKKRTINSFPKGQWSEIWKNFKKNKVAFVALIVLIVIVILAASCDLLFDYNTQAIGNNAKERLMLPSAAHWLGTDNFGRDMLIRILYGARYSLFFGLGCTALSLVFGCLIGAVAAYYGGKTDTIIMRIVDMLMCIPGILLALLIVAVAGAGFTSLLVAVTISNIPGFSRMVRSVVLSIVTQDYVEAARASGTKDRVIIRRHVLPNAVGPILVNCTMQIAGMILTAAGMSYIGMGVQPPTPEWGNMLSEGMEKMRLYPHLVIAPGIAILITALCFNLMGDGLADAIDPKRRRSR